MSLRLVIIIAAFLSCCVSSFAADDARAIAARVGNDTISVGEVANEMRDALADRKIADDEREILQAQTLGLLVNRQLVMQYLQKMKLAATDDQIDAQLTRINSQLKRQQRTLDDLLKDLSLTLSEFRRTLAWKTAWPAYLESKVTRENLQKYFEQHHKDFDGTKVHVAHLLLKVEPPADSAAVQKAVDRAGAILEEIVSKKISFAEAAKQHSQAPTAAEGGDIGLISRHEPMPEVFSEAAFELQPGETSEPILTTFGVHLVHCLAIEPGKLRLADDGVEDAVRSDLVRYLFMWVSEKQRADTKIEFTGALPYFDTATGKLVSKK